MDVIGDLYSEAESALSYIDKEYENPQVRDAVHFLLQEEMRTFAPSSSYLKHLPYPTLKYTNSIMLEAEDIRIKEGGAPTMNKLDTKRYSCDAPEQALERDVQAWRSAVANGKAQKEHQCNRLMNLELAEAHLGSVWLGHNKSLETYEKILSDKSQIVKRKIGELSIVRRKEQESVEPELKKMAARTVKAQWTNWQVADACTQMRMYLQSQGVDYDGEMEVEKEENETDSMNIVDQVEVEVEDNADNLDV